MLSCINVVAQDSIRHEKYIVRSAMVGVGMANVYDTYLSPLEYKGPELRFMHESMRMTRLMGGSVSAQRIVQANISYTDNISKSSNSYSGMFNWTYALHYQYNIDDADIPFLDCNFYIFNKFKIIAFFFIRRIYNA